MQVRRGFGCPGLHLRGCVMALFRTGAILKLKPWFGCIFFDNGVLFRKVQDLSKKCPVVEGTASKPWFVLKWCLFEAVPCCDCADAVQDV